MKKGISLLLSLSCLSIALCSCKPSYTKEELLNMNAEDTFNLLSPVAMDTMEPINYQIDVTTFDGNYGNYGFVPCLNSELCVRSIVENGETLITLVNYKTGETIMSLDNVVDLDTSLAFSVNKIYALNAFPILFYATKEGEDINVNYLDCYGNKIFSEPLQESSSFEVGPSRLGKSEACVTFEYNDTNIYFKATNLNKDEEQIQISRISRAEYQLIEYNIDFEYSLKPLFDKEGNLFGYLRFYGNEYVLYNLNKEIVKKFDCSQFPDFPDVKTTIRLEKKMILFGTLDFANNVKSPYVEWDLVTGETKYVDDFKCNYNIYFVKTIDEYSKFRYTVLTFADKDNSSIVKSTVLTDTFNVDNLIDYDGFYGEVYKINSDYILAEYMDGWHLICKTSNRKIDASHVILEEDNKVYIEKDTRVYCISTETLIDYYGPAKEGYTSEKLYQNSVKMLYFSDRTFNGKRVVIEHNDNTGIYTCNNITLQNSYVFLSFKYGLLIDEYCVRDPNGDILVNYTSTGKIISVAEHTIIGDNSMAFEIKLEKPDGSTVYRYFIHKSVKA